MKILGILFFGLCLNFVAPSPDDQPSEKQKIFNTLVQRSRPENSAHEDIRRMMADGDINPAFRDNAPLLRAVDNNDLKTVQVLLQDQRVDVEARGSNCLVVAAMKKHYEMLTFLLNRGADPKAREYEVFHKAFHSQDSTAINILLNDYRVSIDNHVLFAAVKAAAGNFEILQKLMNHSKFQPQTRKRLLPVALLLNKLDVVKWLLNTVQIPLRLKNDDERQRFLNALFTGSLAGNRTARANAALTIAVREQDENMVAFLMEKKFGEPRPDDLVFAVTKRNVNITRMLLQDGRVDPKIAVREAVLSLDAVLIRLFLTDGRAEMYINSFLFPSTVLGLTERAPIPSDIASKSLPIIEFFLRYHEKVSLQVLLSWLKPALQHNKDGVTALLHRNPDILYAYFFKAVKSGNTYLVDQLIRLSLVDPAAHNNEAIHIAACGYNEYILRDLLKTGMVNPGDRDGVFLAILLDSGNIQALTMMLNHPDCNPSVNSNFALRLAIRKKDMSLVKKILCHSRKRKIDLNIPIYAASTPLMEAVKSCNEEIVSHLITFPRFEPTEADVERALALARNMNNGVLMNMLERLHGVARVRPIHPDNAWGFSVDPARILMWLKASIKELHAYYGDKNFLEFTIVKPVHEMIEDIFAGRRANENPLKRVVGFEPLKLAYEDFMQSRPAMTEAGKKDLFVLIMLTDFTPEFIVYDQPEVTPVLNVVSSANRKRTEQEGQSLNSSQPRAAEVSGPAPKRRRTNKQPVAEALSDGKEAEEPSHQINSASSSPSIPTMAQRQSGRSSSRFFSLNLKRTRLQEREHQQQQNSEQEGVGIMSPQQPAGQVPADQIGRIIVRFVFRPDSDDDVVPESIDVLRIDVHDMEAEDISAVPEDDRDINPLFSSLIEVAENEWKVSNQK